MLAENLKIILPIFLAIGLIYLHYLIVKPNDILSKKSLSQFSEEELVAGHLHRLVSIRIAKNASLLVFFISTLVGLILITLNTINIVFLDNSDYEFKYSLSLVILIIIAFLSFYYYRFLAIKYFEGNKILNSLDKNNIVDKTLDLAIEENSVDKGRDN